MKDLIVVGSSNMDLVINMPRIPLAGETILGGKSSMIFGGKGANQAVTAARLGGKMAFITKLGKDIFGDNMKLHFANEGLPTEYIFTDANEPTGIAQIFVSDKGENVIAVAPGSNGTLSMDDLKPFEHLIANAKVILLQLEIPIETVSKIIDLAHQHQVKVILNPAPAQTLSTDLLKKVWLLTPNEHEASLLTGIQVIDVDSAKESALYLLHQGIENVIITLGENGCLLCNKKGSKHYSAFKTTPVDTTAAGDVFNGALAVAITQNQPFEKSIPFANAAASISVGRKGAQTSIPQLKEVVALLE